MARCLELIASVMAETLIRDNESSGFLVGRLKAFDSMFFVDDECEIAPGIKANGECVFALQRAVAENPNPLQNGKIHLIGHRFDSKLCASSRVFLEV